MKKRGSTLSIANEINRQGRSLKTKNSRLRLNRKCKLWWMDLCLKLFARCIYVCCSFYPPNKLEAYLGGFWYFFPCFQFDGSHEVAGTKKEWFLTFSSTFSTILGGFTPASALCVDTNEKRTNLVIIDWFD